jgi:hypothetical protein
MYQILGSCFLGRPEWVTFAMKSVGGREPEREVAEDSFER